MKETFSFTNTPKFRELFDGTLQKYKWKCWFPNHYTDSSMPSTSLFGFAYASTYTELINTIHLQLTINRYPPTLTIQFSKV